MAEIQIADAKLVGALWLYIHNGVAVRDHAGKMGACDQPHGNSPKPYIDITLQGGQGMYLLTAVVNGKIQEIATCGPDGTNITLTTWALQNGWIVTGKQIMNIS